MEFDAAGLSLNLEELKKAIINGDFVAVKDRVEKAIADDVDPRWMLQEVMIPALEVVGQRFSSGEIFIPEMLISAKAMEAGLEVINPILAGCKEDIMSIVRSK